jgi:hypothetical protein
MNADASPIRLSGNGVRVIGRVVEVQCRPDRFHRGGTPGNNVTKM